MNRASTRGPSASGTQDGGTVGRLSPRRVTWLGLVVNALLAAVKVTVGLAARSQTILADGLHSASDLVTDVAVLAGLRVSERPADEDHHYGHHRVTTLVTMFVGAALLAAAVWIVVGAVASFMRPGPGMTSSLPLWVALGSIPFKEWLFRITRRVGLRASNDSLIANAWHHRSDAFSSIAAAAGLAGVVIGGPRWAFLDHLTAVVLAAFLAVMSLRIMYESASELIDRAPDRDTLDAIAGAVRGTEGVRSYHALRARKLGGRLELDVHIQVDPKLTVREGHDIASKVRSRIRNCCRDVLEAVVHIEPAEDGPE